MVRKQNERTLILQSPIIPLSLPTNFNLSYFSTSPPFHKIGGFPFPPETFSHKFFPKFFLPKGRLTFCCIFGAKNYVLLGELFSIFMARKIMGAKGSCRSPNGGGSLFVCSLYSKGRSISSSRSESLSSSIVANFQSIGANFQQKGAKVRFYLVCLGVFSGFSETKRGENLIYF